MVLTPFATSAVEPIWQRYERWRGGPPVQVYQVPDQSLQNHIIIVGYGRVGRYTADVLQRLNLPFIVIDQDQRAVDRAKAADQPVIYGDASSPVVLEAAGVHDARLVLVVVSAAIDVELVVRQIHVLSPHTHIVARATRLAQVEDLRRYGVHEIVQPEFEAGLELVRQTLLHFDFPAPRSSTSATRSATSATSRSRRCTPTRSCSTSCAGLGTRWRSAGIPSRMRRRWPGRRSARRGSGSAAAPRSSRCCARAR